MKTFELMDLFQMFIIYYYLNSYWILSKNCHKL
jgi:hypothetical protein